MAGQIEHTYILKYNVLCKECGFINKGEQISHDQMDVLACGECGIILHELNSLSKHDKNIMQNTINLAMEDYDVPM